MADYPSGRHTLVSVEGRDAKLKLAAQVDGWLAMAEIYSLAVDRVHARINMRLAWTNALIF